MSKHAWRAFLDWLDQADDGELRDKHLQALDLQEKITDAELTSQLRRMIRLMEEEQVIRLGIAERQRASRP